MKRKKILAFIATMVLATSSLSACGNVDLDSMTYDETVDYADDYGIEVTIEPTEDVVIIVDETEVEETDVGEDKTVVEDEAVVEETDVGEDEVVAEEPETTKTETTKTGGSSGSTSNSSSGSTTSGSANTGGSSSSVVENVQPATPAPAAPAPATPAPTHTHNWKEHTATKQVWIPNIVVVPEYEDKVVGRVDDVAICDCGYTTTDRDDIAQHVKDCIRSGNSSGFTIQQGHDIIERVQVGYHEEDHGHYETQTYVDYYYCECGERK